MPTYTQLATAVPIIPTPTTGLQNPTSETPLVGEKLALGDSIAIMHKVNRNLGRAEILGRYGGGAYAVLTGLGLSIGSGLNVVVAAGQALIDGPRTVTTPTNVAVPDGITPGYGAIWMSQAGALSATSTLTAPAGNVCLLGLFRSNAGSVTDVDESGVLRYEQGGIVVRQTADPGCPGDTPPSGVRFLHKCVGGLWYWDGLQYHLLTNSGISTLNFSSDANKTLTAAQYSARFLSFAATGTTLTAQRNVVLPLSPAGRLWTVENNSPGGQGLQFIGATGTGVVVATGKYAEIRSNGTNIVRVTPDLP